MSLADLEGVPDGGEARGTKRGRRAFVDRTNEQPSRTCAAFGLGVSLAVLLSSTSEKRDRVFEMRREESTHDAPALVHSTRFA